MDLDSTLVQTKTGAKFAKGPWDWKLTPGVIEAIENYGAFEVNIVSNQSRLTTEKSRNQWEQKVNRILGKLTQELADRGNMEYIPGMHYDYCCASEFSNDPRRKPNPGMLLDVMRRYENFNQNIEFLMVGDASGKPGDFSDSDKKAAENAGIPYMDINDFINTYNYGT